MSDRVDGFDLSDPLPIEKHNCDGQIKYGAAIKTHPTVPFDTNRLHEILNLVFDLPRSYVSDDERGRIYVSQCSNRYGHEGKAERERERHFVMIPHVSLFRPN